MPNQIFAQRVIVSIRAGNPLSVGNFLAQPPPRQFSVGVASSWAMSLKRRFAPLGPGNTNFQDEARPRLKGVVFDVDGTLCKWFLSSIRV
jgi:hypothetical protein